MSARSVIPWSHVRQNRCTHRILDPLRRSTRVTGSSTRKNQWFIGHRESKTQRVFGRDRRRVASNFNGKINLLYRSLHGSRYSVYSVYFAHSVHSVLEIFATHADRRRSTVAAESVDSLCRLCAPPSNAHVHAHSHGRGGKSIHYISSIRSSVFAAVVSRSTCWFRTTIVLTRTPWTTPYERL